MDTLIFSLNAVLPILLTMLLGMLLRGTGMISKTFAEQANKLCCQIAIPLHIFCQLYNADFAAAADWRFIGYGVGFILITFVLLCIISPKVIKNKTQCAEFIQGVFRGNVSLISVSLLTNLYGAAGITAMSFLLPITVILYNSLSVMELSYFFMARREMPVGMVLESVGTNPFVVSSLLGMAFSLLHIRIPTPLMTTLKNVSAIGAPMALLALGATVDLKQMFHCAGLGMIAAVLRQIVIPIIVLAVAIALGFRNAQLAAYLCIVCTPTATVGYVLSCSLGGDGKLSAQILVYSTLLSFISMFVAVWGLRALQML